MSYLYASERRMPSRNRRRKHYSMPRNAPTPTASPSSAFGANHTTRPTQQHSDPDIRGEAPPPYGFQSERYDVPHADQCAWFCLFGNGIDGHTVCDVVRLINSTCGRIVVRQVFDSFPFRLSFDRHPLRPWHRGGIGSDDDRRPRRALPASRMVPLPATLHDLRGPSIHGRWPPLP